MRTPGRGSRWALHALAALAVALLACSTAVAEGPPPEPAPPRTSRRGGDPVPAAMRPLLAAHNRLRARHCAPPLAWSRSLAAFAQSWANRLARRGCVLEHRQRSRYGENLAAGTARIMGPEQVAAGWYGEVKKYRFGRGGFSMRTGHFTQLVWARSERLGCGVAQCAGDVLLWVCNYDPPGNVDGQYRENVRPPGCRR